MENQTEFEFVGECHGFNIPKATREAVIKYLQNNRPKVYADRNDRLSLEQVARILEKPDGILDVENAIWENCMDYSWELEMQAVHELQERFPELANIQDTDIREEFLDYISVVTLTIKGIIRNTPDVVLRITLHSNFEGVGWDR